jgi:sterol desaturase/sphingolipid hydroxylase (fatty acid hydroxylase superfamily)
MHRVHHSEAIPEQNTNFGTVFSLWDRVFGTYLAGPASTQGRYGLAEMANGSEENAARLLFLPFRRGSKRT